MLLKNNPEDPVFQFLAATFHQDTFYEEALQELLEEASTEYLQYAIIFLTDFIKSDYEDNEKNNYIQRCADGIHFESLDITPIEWLKQALETLKEAIKRKE